MKKFFVFCFSVVIVFVVMNSFNVYGSRAAAAVISSYDDGSRTVRRSNEKVSVNVASEHWLLHSDTVQRPSSTVTTTTTVNTNHKVNTTATTVYNTTTLVPNDTTVTTAASALPLNSFLECVKHRESRGDYTAVNSSSGAGGAYQFLQSTWDNTARHVGRYDLVGVHPSNVSPADQDMMARALYEWQGTAPWAGPSC